MKRIRAFLLASLLLSVLLAPARAAEPEAAPYRDVAGTWAEEAVNQYGDPEIFSTGDGCFHPDRAVTRMEFARLLHKAMGLSLCYFAPTDIGDYYDDVSNADPGAGDLYDLAVCGITDPADQFRPSAPLTREEMAHLLVRAFFYLVPRAAVAGVGHEFADEQAIRAEYRTDAEMAFSLGFLKGRVGNLLAPDAEATRAEAVTAAGRLAEALANSRDGVSVRAAAQEENGQLLLTLSVRNDTGKTVTITSGSGQQFDFVLLDREGAELYRWSAGRMFPMMVTKIEIAPGEEKSYTAAVDAETFSSIRERIASARAFLTGSSSDFDLPPEGYPVSLSLGA